MQATNKYQFSLYLQSVIFQIAVLADKIFAAKHPISPAASHPSATSLPLSRGEKGEKHPVSPTARHPSTRGEYPQTDTGHWEREIDRLVYELYGLTEEEIRIVEGK